MKRTVRILALAATVMAFGSAVLFLTGCKATPQKAAPHASLGDPRRDFRPTGWIPFSTTFDLPTHAKVREMLCPAVSPVACQQCLRQANATEAAECILDRAYASDPVALASARDLLRKTGAIASVETQAAIQRTYLGDVWIKPILPVGEHRHHLVWLHDALTEIDTVFAAVAQRAQRDLMFRTRPYGFRFFQTAESSYPSAWAQKGIIGYNVAGPLHATRESVMSTLFHELFHLNDEGHNSWSERVTHVSETYDRIIASCDDGNPETDDDCFTKYAADDTRVPNGTYYAFDARTRDVREYAAEVALRWFLEHREILVDGKCSSPPFKCGAPENAMIWRLVSDEFFGGFDLTPECSEES